MQGQIPLFESYNYFNRTGQDSADGKILDLIGLYTDEYGTTKGVDGLTFVKEMESLIASGVRYIDIRINSGGGSVNDGYSIFSAIQNANQSGVKVDTYVCGAAASMAGVIAMAGRKRYIYDYGFFMLHNPSSNSENLSEKDKEVLGIIKNSLTNIFIGKTGIDYNTIDEMMNQETWMSPAMAQEKGFFDEVLPSGLKIAAKGNIISNYQYLCNQFLTDTKPKNVMEDKNKIVQALNNNTDAELDAAKAELEKLKAEKEALNAKVAEMENAQKEAEKLKAQELVEDLHKQGKITEEQKADTLEFALNKYEACKNFFSSMNIKQAAKLPKFENSATVIEKAKDFYELSVENPKELERLQKEEPREFERLRNEWLEKRKNNKR